MRKPKPQRGPGRPESQEPLSVTIGVRLTEPDAERIKEAARKEDRPLGQWARRALISAANGESATV